MLFVKQFLRVKALFVPAIPTYRLKNLFPESCLGGFG